MPVAGRLVNEFATQDTSGSAQSTMLSSNSRKFFFKYYSPETAKKVLETCTRRWSNPALFNDPFDTQFELFADVDAGAEAPKVLSTYLRKRKAAGKSVTLPPDLRARALPAARESVQRYNSSVEEINTRIRNRFAKTTLFCVSELNDNLLMWAHYAKDHTGVVAKFLCVPGVDTLCIAQQVKYSCDMPKMGRWDLVPGVGEQIFRLLALTKSKDWAYEKEWRVIRYSERQSETYEDISFAPEELGALYLGWKIEEALKPELINIARRKFPKAEIYQARPHPQKFKLEFGKL